MKGRHSAAAAAATLTAAKRFSDDIAAGMKNANPNPVCLFSVMSLMVSRGAGLAASARALARAARGPLGAWRRFSGGVGPGRAAASAGAAAARGGGLPAAAVPGGGGPECVTVKRALGSALGAELVVRGWVRSVRAQKSVSFMEVNDGSCVPVLQVGTAAAHGSHNQYI